MATHAAMLMFHLPFEKRTDLLELLDGRLGPRCREHPGFRRLLCLESSEALGRGQIFVFLLWDDATFEEIAELADVLGDEASQALGVGVARHGCWVVRSIPGDDPNTVSS